LRQHVSEDDRHHEQIDLAELQRQPDRFQPDDRSHQKRRQSPQAGYGRDSCSTEHPAHDVTHAGNVHQKTKRENGRLAQPDQREKAQRSEWRVVEQHRV
jgi:hypothetical protein